MSRRRRFPLAMITVRPGAWAIAGAAAMLAACHGPTPEPGDTVAAAIDREALVTRHDPELHALDPESPFTLGLAQPTESEELSPAGRRRTLRRVWPRSAVPDTHGHAGRGLAPPEPPRPAARPHRIRVRRRIACARGDLGNHSAPRSLARHPRQPFHARGPARARDDGRALRQGRPLGAHRVTPARLRQAHGIDTLPAPLRPGGKEHAGYGIRFLRWTSQQGGRAQHEQRRDRAPRRRQSSFRPCVVERRGELRANDAARIRPARSRCRRADRCGFRILERATVRCRGVRSRCRRRVERNRIRTLLAGRRGDRFQRQHRSSRGRARTAHRAVSLPAGRAVARRVPGAGDRTDEQFPVRQAAHRDELVEFRALGALGTAAIHRTRALLVPAAPRRGRSILPRSRTAPGTTRRC